MNALLSKSACRLVMLYSLARSSSVLHVLSQNPINYIVYDLTGSRLRALSLAICNSSMQDPLHSFKGPAGGASSARPWSSRLKAAVSGNACMLTPDDVGGTCLICRLWQPSVRSEHRRGG